jgi:hypothetical protein
MTLTITVILTLKLTISTLLHFIILIAHILL